MHESTLAILDAYGLTGNQKMRIHNIVYRAIQDAQVITWLFKYLYEIPRPNQLDQHLSTLICTPNHPSYPGGHAVIGSTVTELLSLLFPDAKSQLDHIMEDNKRARFGSGVHYPVDNDNGEILGRKIGRHIFNIMKKEKDEEGKIIDTYVRNNKKLILRVQNRRDLGIYTCKSLIDRRSFIYSRYRFHG